MIYLNLRFNGVFDIKDNVVPTSDQLIGMGLKNS